MAEEEEEEEEEKATYRFDRVESSSVELLDIVGGNPMLLQYIQGLVGDSNLQ